MFADVEADIYVLVDGDDTYDAAAAPRDGAAADGGTARHGERRAGDGAGGGVPARPSARQRGAHRLVRRIFGTPDHRHAVGLPRVQPPLRQILPRAGRRFRDRDRIDRPRARAEDAGGRNAGRLQGPPGGLGLQAADLLGRRPHPAHHRRAGEGGAAAAVLLPVGRGAAGARPRPRLPGGGGVLPHRPGAAPAHRRPRHRPRAAVVPGLRLRPDPRQRGARPQGAEAPDLSGDPGRAGAG